MITADHNSSSPSILNTLKKYVDRGTNPIAPLWHHKLKTDWWSKVTPCFLYACSCGSLIAVKYFIDNGLEPTIWYILFSTVLILGL